MFWYIVFAIVYLVALLVLLVFIAGATKLARHAEAEDRMRPRRCGPADLRISPKRYRDAA